MATATTAAARTIALSLIHPSKDNPRSSVEKEPLAELAASIKEKGVLEPIMVRPDGKEFEIVFGERRFKAAKLAGLKDLPVIVRSDLSEADAAEIRLIENMQRVDLPPLDEAAGFTRLQTEQKYTVAEICAKLGKKPGYIYARLALLNLPDAAKDALRQGALTEAVALVIARIPNAKQREKAAGEILRDPSKPMSLNEARALVRERFMLSLAHAPFDPADAALTDAGACTNCPKRTGSAPALFEDLKTSGEDNLCLDSQCFAAKRQAAWERATARAKEKGLAVIPDAGAKKVFAYGRLAPGAGYVDLDDTCYDDPKHRTWRQVLGKGAPKPTLARVPQTFAIKHLVPADVARKALGAAAPEIQRAASKSAKLSAAREKELAAQQRRTERERIGAEAVADAVLAKAGKTAFGAKHWRLIVDHLLQSGYGDNLEPLARAWGLLAVADETFTVDDAYKAIRDVLKTAHESKLRVAVVALTVATCAGYGRFTPLLKQAADVFNVDVRAVTSKAVKTFDAEKKKAKKEPEEAAE